MKEPLPWRQTSCPDFGTLNRKFTAYIRSFSITDPRIRAHFDLKIRHTREVVRNMEYIAREEGMNERTTELARAIALLHDLGRFRQFAEYGTFDDSISLNHAELSVILISQEGFARFIPESDMEILTTSILQHNRPAITLEAGSPALLYSRLLRDADKTDIWRIQSKADVVYAIGEFKEETNHYVVPAGILESFRNNRIIRVEMARSVNDFRLLRLGWIFDMNFPSTFRLLVKKGYADSILSRVPDSPEVREIAAIVHHYMDRRSL